MSFRDSLYIRENSESDFSFSTHCNEILTIKEDPEHTFINIKIEEDESLEYEIRNHCTEDPLATNNNDWKVIKQEAPFMDMKKEVPDEITEEQKFLPIEDGKYSIDVKKHKVEYSDDNDKLPSMCKDNFLQQSKCESRKKGTTITGNTGLSAHLLQPKQDRKPSEDIPINNLNLLRNIEKVHNGKHECSYCHHRFFSKGHLNVHVNAVHKKIKHECTECHKLFTREDNLKAHIKTLHNSTKSHKCNECCKMFSSAVYLKNHINAVHKKIGNYECNICHKMSSCARYLREHIWRVHKKIKNFKCNECPKLFSRNNILKEHVNRKHRKIMQVK